MLLGRAPECERIERLVAQARTGVSGVLVLRGEPGIGKTALLEHAAAAAGAATVLRVRGVESEVEVAFAGLHELLRPVLGEFGRLPGPQRAALEAALGLAPAAAGEPHLVGAATLGLLAALAEERLVVVLADDVQWLDGPSAAALTFATRRLLADAVAVLLAVRAGEPSPIDGVGLEELVLSGLAAEPARELLAAHAARPVAADTAGWLHAATGGNPLALVELAGEAPRLRPGPVGDHVPIGDRIERALRRRLDRLPAEAWPAMLALAVADDDELEPVLTAARELGGSLGALEAAEAAGLVSLAAGRVAFRHPLVRSAVLARAAPADRRGAHRAYAAALDPVAGSERRAWHVAAATLEADEAVAASLAAAAAGAGERGGHAAAAAAFEQAARLSPDPPSRAQRLRRAADAAWLGGDGPRALALLDEAAPIAVSVAERAEAGHLRGRVLARRGPLPLAVRTLREAAEAVAAAAPAKAAEVLADATHTALYGHGLAADMEEIARRSVELAPPGDTRARSLAATALGAALVMAGRPEAAGWLRGGGGARRADAGAARRPAPERPARPAGDLPARGPGGVRAARARDRPGARARRGRRAAVRALLSGRCGAREPALGRGRRPLRGGAAAGGGDGPAPRRGELAGRPRAARGTARRRRRGAARAHRAGARARVRHALLRGVGAARAGRARARRR